MLKVFVGSSSESYTPFVVPFRTVLFQAAKEHGPKIDVRTWRDEISFKYGEFILESLQRQLAESDLSIFFFSSDDERTMRGERSPIPRDNVVFEAGISFAQLGRERTVMLVEEGARLPADFEGLIFHKFSAGTSSEKTARFEAISRLLLADWAKLSPLHKGSRLELAAPVGLRATIESSREKLDQIEHALVSGHLGKPIHEPIVLSAEACLSAYVEALPLVEKRFWTTTFFTSGFWRANSGEVLRANTEMMKRLQSRGDADVRRLFLLPIEFERFLTNEGEKIAHLRRTGNESAILDLERELDQIDEYVKKMVDHGCEVRLANDDAITAWTKLSSELKDRSEANDTEIAIFDNFRIDMYRGGKSGNITRLASFPNTFANFEAHLDRAEQYFENLWRHGMDGPETIEKWRATIAYWQRRIDYHTNWIARYEYDLEDRDKQLKASELAAAVEAIRSAGQFGTIDAFLDIGTCTARYPIELCRQHALKPEARIIALDEDSDCIEFARAKIRDENLDGRISLVQSDFLRDGQPELVANSFGLVTCMLGTMSHFGGLAGTRGGPSGRLPVALKKMQSMLRPGGLLLLGNWSERAREAGQFLRIYRAEDRARLQAWTPTQSSLREAIEQAGLTVSTIKSLELGIDLFVCRLAAD